MIVAHVRFLPQSNDCGRLTPPRSGYHPQIELDDVQTSCRIESLENTDVMAFGVVHKVELTLLFAQHCAHMLYEGRDVRFFEGSNLVGDGKIVSVTQGGRRWPVCQDN